jgi:hypothetical protein
MAEPVDHALPREDTVRGDQIVDQRRVRRPVLRCRHASLLEAVSAEDGRIASPEIDIAARRAM